MVGLDFRHSSPLVALAWSGLRGRPGRFSRVRFCDFESYTALLRFGHRTNEFGAFGWELLPAADSGAPDPPCLDQAPHARDLLPPAVDVIPLCRGGAVPAPAQGSHFLCLHPPERAAAVPPVASRQQVCLPQLVVAEKG